VSRTQLQNNPRNIEIDERFMTPIKGNRLDEYKEMPTTGILESPVQDNERSSSEYKYQVKAEQEEAKTGCGFCRGG
jgi:hypothetical protein